jgi:hypothetical protein
MIANTPSYSVRRPISSDPTLRREGAVVSRHRTLEAAMRSLQRQQRGAQKHGGYSLDYIWDERAGREATA